MSPNDMKNLIYTVGKVSNTMKDQHLKMVQSILISAQRSNRCVFFKFMTLKLSIQYLTNLILKSDNILDLFSKQQTKLLFKVLGQYNYFPKCALCGKIIDMSDWKENERKQPESPVAFSWDHIYPKSFGGTTHLSNMQPTHKICNNIKADKIPYEYLPRVIIDIQMPKYKNLRPQIFINTR